MKGLEEALRKIFDIADNAGPGDPFHALEKILLVAEAALSRAITEAPTPEPVSLSEAVDLGRQSWQAKRGKCSMCAAGEAPIDGLHRGKHKCGNIDADQWLRNSFYSYHTEFSREQVLQCMEAFRLALAGETHTAGGWISTKEKLPKYGEWCLVVWNGKVQHSAAQLNHFDHGDYWNWADEGYDSARCLDMEMWQPLPSPPKGGQ